MTRSPSPIPPAPIRPSPRRRPVAAWLLPLLSLLVLLSSPACRPDDELDEDDEEEELVLPRRRAAVLLDGCSLDTAASTTLRGAAAQKVVSEVILLCLSVDDQGQVAPRDGITDAALRATIADLRRLGYAVGLGLTAVDSDDDEQPKEEISAWLSQLLWRQRSVGQLATYASFADSLQIALPEILSTSRANLTAWVGALSGRLRPASRIGMFIPPSLAEPSDQPGGDAYDVVALLPSVDRLRVLSVEAAGGEAPGPTFDASWVGDAGTFALRRVPAEALDVAVPLYGVDFQLQPGASRTITDESTLSHSEALALAKKYGKTPEGGAGQARHFAYTDSSNNPHEVWYEDSDSILEGLATLTADVLPAGVGLVLVGLGGEDPQLFTDIVDATPDDAAK